MNILLFEALVTGHQLCLRSLPEGRHLGWALKNELEFERGQGNVLSVSQREQQVERTFEVRGPGES